MTRTCSYCSSSISDADSFCQGCGRPAGVGNLFAPQREPATAFIPSTDDHPAWPATATGGDGGVLPSASGNGRMLAAVVGAEGHITQSPTGFEPSFDPIDNPRFRAQLFQRARLYILMWFIGGFVSFVVCLILGLIALGIPGALTLWGVAGAIVGVVLLAAFLLLKIPIQLADWNVSIDGKGAAAPSAFDHMAYSLQRRQTPLEALRVRRLNLPGGEGQRDYLELQRGFFYGYVSCFAFGRDLYVGWTFWIQMSPLSMFVMFFVRIWETIMHKTSDIYMTLRYESAKAMRDALHAATREGADVAAGSLQGQGQGIIGSTVRIV